MTPEAERWLEQVRAKLCTDEGCLDYHHRALHELVDMVDDLREQLGGASVAIENPALKLTKAELLQERSMPELRKPPPVLMDAGFATRIRATTGGHEAPVYLDPATGQPREERPRTKSSESELSALYLVRNAIINAGLGVREAMERLAVSDAGLRKAERWARGELEHDGGEAPP